MSGTGKRAGPDPAQRELALLALDVAKGRGASYADVRIIETRSQDVGTKNEKVSRIHSDEDLGFGVRVIADGSWGFACSSRLEKAEVERVAGEAVQIAKASATVQRQPVQLAAEDAYEDVWETPHEEDPFDVPLGEKVDLLLQINAELRKVKSIAIAVGWMGFEWERQLFASTEGSVIQQNLLTSAAGYMATAVGGGDQQRRSFPSSHRGQVTGRGYEMVRELPLLENAPRVAEEADALLTAPQCPLGAKDLILGGDQLALQIHESLGHPSELDRVLGTEANFAGTSFITTDKLGKLKYGSDIVNFVADSTVPQGLATIGYDDEGVKAQQWHLVRDGLFVGYLTSRETAPVIGEERSQGAMRAMGWRRMPIIRMTNISLMPGEWTLDALIEDTRDGIFMDCNRSWSIDQQRVNFQFGTEIGWEIKNGKRTRMLKNPTYEGITTEFWNSCDAICDEDHFVLWGVPNCGKGEPSQTAQMSHGAAPTRFRNVKVGVGYAE
ncbi:MAG: TldD/PmbA family protein [Armatimonadota bacterium]